MLCKINTGLIYMSYLNILTGENIVEGLVASIMIVLSYMILRNYFNISKEINFIIEDGQTIARIKYEKLNKKTSMVYGTQVKSNYQTQKLALSKHFK